MRFLYNDIKGRFSAEMHRPTCSAILLSGLPPTTFRTACIALFVNFFLYLLKMPSISQSAMSNTSSSQAPDLPSNIDSAQVSAYAQALLAGSNISPASFREVRILSVSVIY